MKLIFYSSFFVFVTISFVDCNTERECFKPDVDQYLTLEPMDPELCSTDNVTFICTGNNVSINETVGLYNNDDMMYNVSGCKKQFVLSYTLINVGLTNTFSTIACIVGGTTREAYSMLTVKKIFQKNLGCLSPIDPHVCVSDTVSFTCTLLDNPEPNKTISFYTKSSSSPWTAVEEADITVVNTSESQFTHTVNISDVPTAQVVCYYSEPATDGSKPSVVYQLDTISTIVASNPSNPNITDFKCIAYNFVDSMNCSWKYGGHFTEKPTVSFDWRIRGYSDWNACSDLNSENNYCYFPSTDQGDFSTKEIEVQIVLNYKTCGEDAERNATFDYRVDTKKIVKPNPVGDLTAVAINSTCIQLDWNTADSRPEYGKTQEIRATTGTSSSDWHENKTVEIVPGGTDSKSLHTYTFCGLQECIKYTFTVRTKPIGLSYDGYWSDPRSTENTTLSAVPSASPNVTTGGYSWNPQVCQSENTRRVCFMLQLIDPMDENGKMKGLEIVYKSDSEDSTSNIADEDLLAQDSIYFCKTLSCKENYRVMITPTNDAGKANKTSIISVSKWNADIVQPSLKVETIQGSNQTVYLHWSNPHVPNAIRYEVFRCTKYNGGCKLSGGVMEWQSYPISTQEVVLDMHGDSAELFSFGVSLVTDTSSSGLQWETCVYTKGACPTEAVKHIDVSTGSEDDTLVVNWDKLPCKSGEPYIDCYIVTYCEVSSQTCHDKEVSGDEGRIVIYDLEEKKYSVKVKGVNTEGGVNASGCSGLYSDLKYGTPEHKALKSGEIVGIAMACLLVVIMAGIGLFCCFRRSKDKFRNWKRQAGAVKVPDSEGHIMPKSYNLHEYLNPSVQPDDTVNTTTHKFERQDSGDSGVPETPKAEEVKKPEFKILPDGYCVAQKINEEREGDASRVIHNTENNNSLIVANEPIVGFVHDSPTPGLVETPSTFTELKLSLKNPKSSETGHKDMGIPSGYNIATLPSNATPSNTTTGSEGNDSSSSKGEKASPAGTGQGIAEPSEKLITLASIPTPIPEYMQFSRDDDSSSSNVNEPTSHGPNSQSSNQTPSPYVLSTIMHGDNHQSSNKTHVTDDGDSHHSDQTPSSYVLSTVMHGDNHQSSNQTPSPYVASPITYDDNNQSSDQTPSPYVTSPITYDDNNQSSDQTQSPYVSSPVTYDDCSLSSNPTPSSYVSSPVINDRSLISNPTPSSYVSSPVTYGDDNKSSNQTPSPYVTSPITYDDNNQSSNQTPSPYVASPITYDDNNQSSNQTPSPYVTSPITYDDNNQSSNQTPSPYVASPITYDDNNQSSNRTPSPYVASPITYDDNNQSSNRTPSPYVASPITYDDNNQSSNQTPSPYVTSPITYGDNNQHSNQTSSPYVPLPVLCGDNSVDISPPDQMFSCHANSPVVPNTNQVVASVDNPLAPQPSDYVSLQAQPGSDNTDNILDHKVKSPFQSNSNTCTETMTSPLPDTESVIRTGLADSGTPDSVTPDGNNDITQNESTPLTITTPYVDSSKMEMLLNTQNKALTIDCAPLSEFEDDYKSDVSDSLSVPTHLGQSPDVGDSLTAPTQLPNQTTTVEQGYVTMDTVLRMNNQQHGSITGTSVHQPPSGYIDISKMESLARQTQTSQDRTTSCFSEDSIAKDLVDENKLRHNSDSGLSSMENSAD